MTEFPISCIRCRRRKIKCNKHYPCNQCSIKGFQCEFPAKFRNRSIDESAASYGNMDSNTELTNSSSPADIQKLIDEIERLKMENNRLERLRRPLEDVGDIEDVGNTDTNVTGTRTGTRTGTGTGTTGETAHQRQKIDDSASNSEVNEIFEHQGELFPIAGETSELGQKYYGPFSSNTMLESLLLSNQNDQVSEKHHQHMWTSNPNKLTSDSDPLTPNRGQGNYDCPKKPLPWVLEKDDSDERNKEVIKNLVKFFFELPKYHYFLSEASTLQFINSHALISDDDWDGDDDLLLLHMILVLAVRRLSPVLFNLCGLTDRPVKSAEEMYKRIDSLVTKRLAWGYQKLRHNLVSETFLTVQSYILCAEYQFTEQRYEESWSMLFHCCSVAFAIGLHVVVNMDPPTTTQSFKPSSSSVDIMAQDISMGTESDIPPDNDNFYQISKIKIWFALRNISGHICSILGRPNPILIQLDLKVLLLLYGPQELNSGPNNTTMIQLKCGLSECTRLLNLMLIESYIMNVSEQEVLNLDAKFNDESKVLQYFISQDYQNVNTELLKRINPVTELPLVVDREDALSDLIILHVNRIKILERFLSIQSDTSRVSISFIMESILLFAEYSCEFVQEYVNNEVPQFLDENGKLITEDRIDKVFLIKFPFVSAFIYQGIIVIFIFLRSKRYEFLDALSIECLNKLENKIQLLLDITCSECNFGCGSLNLWSPNICYLMKQILDRKEKLVKQYIDFKENRLPDSQFEDFETTQSLNKIFRMSGEDPFWATNSYTAPFLMGMGPFDYGLPDEQNNQNFQDNQSFQNNQSFKNNQTNQDYQTNQTNQNGQNNFSGQS